MMANAVCLYKYMYLFQVEMGEVRTRFPARNKYLVYDAMELVYGIAIHTQQMVEKGYMMCDNATRLCAGLFQSALIISAACEEAPVLAAVGILCCELRPQNVP